MSIEWKQLEKIGAYDEQKTLAQILVDLTNLVNISVITEERLRQWRIFSRLVPTAVCIVVGICLLPYYAKLGSITIFVLLITYVTSSRLMESHAKKLHQRIFLAERFRAVLAILQALRADMSQQQQIRLCQSLTLPTSPISSIPHPQYQKMQVDRYRDSWLRLEGGLIDRTIFSLKICEFRQVTHGQKRGSSGKMRVRRKEKSKGGTIDLVLNYSRNRYQPAHLPSAKVQQLVKLPQTAKIKRCQIKQRELRLSVAYNAVDIDGLTAIAIAMFLSLYEILQAAPVSPKRVGEPQS